MSLKNAFVSTRNTLEKTIQKTEVNPLLRIKRKSKITPEYIIDNSSFDSDVNPFTSSESYFKNQVMNSRSTDIPDFHDLKSFNNESSACPNLNSSDEFQNLNLNEDEVAEGYKIFNLKYKKKIESEMDNIMREYNITDLNDVNSVLEMQIKVLKFLCSLATIEKIASWK
jgi:hypothetical protein